MDKKTLNSEPNAHRKFSSKHLPYVLFIFHLMFSLSPRYTLWAYTSKLAKARTPEGLIVFIHFLGPA